MTRPTLEARYLRFHADNIHVYRRLAELAREWRSARSGPMSIASLYERLRWDEIINSTGDPFRLSNDFRAFYARLLMHLERGVVFDLRPSVADMFGHPVQPTLWDEVASGDGWLERAARIVREGS